jgi:transmembrane sensor
MFWGRKSKRSIRQQAAEWVGRVNRGELSEDKLQEFHGWLADPRNAREFESQHAVLGAVADLSPGSKADLVRCVQADRRKRPAAQSWRPADLFASRPVLASAVSIALAVTVTAGWLRLRETGGGPPPNTYATAVGESRTVVFPDGSVAYLNTQTELQWVGSDRDRRVRLKTGEALFEVVHDQARPFRIYLDHSVIRVLGTKFDVYRKANGNVVVTVLNGTVAVEGVEDGDDQPLWHRELVADQQLEYGSNGIAADVHSTHASKVVRWREGELETSGEALLSVVTELNRYTRKPIVIADPRVGTAPIGGTFSVYDIDSTLRRIQLIAPISITHTDAGFVLSYRAGYRHGVPPPSKSLPAPEDNRS